MSIFSVVGTSLAKEEQQQKPQEVIEAQQMAIDLELEKIIENIVTNAGIVPDATKAEWEGCQLTIEHKPSDPSDNFSIVMSNGQTLYKAKRNNWNDVTVTDFRYGAWVERIKAYSEQLKIQPFSQIDF